MIFIDSNIPMYLIGAEHPLKTAAERLVARYIAEKLSMVTDAEVFQEILHRYTAIDRPNAIRPAFDWLRAVADDVFPIDMTDVNRASEIIAGKRRLSARDAIHAAVMERHGVTRILSFDSGFDSVRGIERIWD